MKSRRVTRLLACGLAMCMFTVPVYAMDSSLEPNDVEAEGSAYSGTVNIEFSTPDVMVRATVPTQSKVAVNPFATGAANTVSGASIASKDLKIVNKTYTQTDPDDNTTRRGVSLNVTATAMVKEIASGVNVYYDESLPTDATDARFLETVEEKNAIMQLQEGAFATARDISSNVTYGSGDKATVTELGSRIALQVDAPAAVSSDSTATVSDDEIGCGAMAIIGKATVAADWQNTDMGIDFAYTLRASSVDPASSTSLGNMTVTGSSTKVEMAITAATLNKATIAGIAMQNGKDNSYGFQALPEDGYTMTTATNGDVKITLAQPIMDIVKTVKGAKQNVLVKLSDGRVLIDDFTIN